MAYKFQLGSAIVSGSLTRDAGDLTIRAHDNSVKITLDTAGAIDAAGSVTAGSSFIIGSADLNEVDMEKLDGITNGTAAANKALVADGNIDIASLRNVTATGDITAGGSFIIGSADLNETDMEQLDGITKGTAAANKAMVTDASNNIASLGTLGCGAITSTGLGTFVGVAAGGAITTATTIGASGKITGNEFATDGDEFQVSDAGQVTAVGVVAGGAVSSATTVSGSGKGSFLSIALDSVDVTATAAELNFNDGATAGTAVASKTLVVDANKDIASLRNVTATGTYTGNLVNSLDVEANGGVGMTPFNNSAAVADLKLSASYLTAEAVAVSEDQFLFYDADGGVHRESFSDLATAMAGAGITATNGVLSTEAGATTGSVPDGATLIEGYNFITGTTGGSYTLPNGPSAGDRVVFKNSSAGTATIAGFAANTVDGVSSIILESPYAAVTMVYSKVSGSWAIV
jgi:hypothetical protein